MREAQTFCRHQQHRRAKREESDETDQFGAPEVEEGILEARFELQKEARRRPIAERRV